MRHLSLLLWVASILPTLAGVDPVVTINEIHYHPAGSADPEWVELHNQMSIRVDLGNWTLRGGTDFTIPEGTVLGPGQYLVISSSAGNPTGALGPLSGKLSNKGDEIRLHERHGRMMDQVTFADSGDWPAEADGSGKTLAKRFPDLAGEAAQSWRASSAAGGTPGGPNFGAPVEPLIRRLFLAGATWKYRIGDAPPSGWQEAGFDDAAWPASQAAFASSAAPGFGIQPVTLWSVAPSHQVRRAFAYTGGLSNPVLMLAGPLIGEADIWLNGTKIAHCNATRGRIGIAVADAPLVTGVNQLAVEISGNAAAWDCAATLVEATPDETPPSSPAAGPVVINEIHYHQHPVYPNPSAGIAFAENPLEWIELHNRSASEVDLSGWSLGDAVTYSFPDGTKIAAGGFLVVSQTQFSGKLSNSDERILLLDAFGTEADAVHYFDGGRWPNSADGGGSSLELVDPAADNSKPGVWAASAEAHKSVWQTFTYTALGAAPPNSNDPANWREFLLGFLDAGEALIDDVSVIEDPDGTPVQVIQNGSFETDAVGQPPAKWRLLGTHKLGRVVANPDGPGNVLHLIATDTLEHTYNVASTTLAGNRSIDPGKSYQISFRARWLSGSPQLNSRLYFNRAARTQILPQPAATGTPGAPNSRRVANAGPVFDHLRHGPVVPAASQLIRIAVDAADPDGIGAMNVFYSVNQGIWQEATMAGDAAGRWTAVLPGQPDNAIVQFYVHGEDAFGNAADYPAGGPASRALLRVGAGGVASGTIRNTLRLVMTAADAAQLHDPLQAVSNFRWGATLISNDRDIFYDAGVRLRSAPYGRQGPRAGWNIRLGPEQPFRGAYEGIVIDGALNMPRGDGTGWIETTLGPSLNEMLYQIIANRSGGVAASFDDMVYFGAPRSADNRKAQLKMARFNGSFLDEYFGDDADGTRYKQELIYYPTTTVDGNPESLKNPYTNVLQVDVNNMGTSPDSYRFNYLLQNNTDRDDFSRIVDLANALNAPSAQLQAQTDAVLDTDNWMRVLALNALIGLADTYNQGGAHNLQFFARPSDNRVLLMPWDQDHAFYYPTTYNIFGGGTHKVKDVIALPANRRLFCQHLLDFCTTGFTNAYLDSYITHLNQTAGQNYALNFKNWISARRTFVLGQINAQHPATAFAITTNSGNDFSTASPVAVVEGTGWVDVYRIRIERNGAGTGAGEPEWINGSSWRLFVPVIAGANSITLTALDRQGNVLGTDQIQISSTAESDAAADANLVVSEIAYHPAPPSNAEISAGFADAELFEFVEITNISSRQVDLTGAAFTAGVHYSFAGGVLPHSGRLVLAANAQAFQFRHGFAPAGVFVGNLANNGEAITLLDAGGNVIRQFTYNDKLPWPPEADGYGPSLTLIQPAANPDHNVAANWRPSRFFGGSPSGADALEPGGFASELDYAFLSVPKMDGSGIVWTERLGADGLRLVPQLSTDLSSWSGDASIQIVSSTADGAGGRQVRISVPVDGPRKFFRILLAPR